ncbi:unnamed protein product [Effrenium voratum]|uniref:WWE domain-containing protein n=1 Tax=Effrenium voratum TaxID=2562239 RepID=A0AA36NBR8_9DINO|nr:unnamed protein product [Effrenium voratum]
MKKLSNFCVIQGLEDTQCSEAERFYVYRYWGTTGRGSKLLDGPCTEERADKSQEAMRHAAAQALGEKKHLGYSPQAAPCEHQLCLPAKKEEKARWQYYVDDCLDGKRRGWHPFEAKAAAQVEEIYRRSREKVVSSSLFSYTVDLAAGTQRNTKTGKVRQIRRLPTQPVRKAPTKRPGGVSEKLKVKKTITKAAVKGRATKAAKLGRPKAATAGKSVKPKSKAKPMKLSKPKVCSIASGPRAKSLVWCGKKTKTSTGLKKEDMTKNKFGRLVSKRRSAAGRTAFGRVSRWIAACKQARAELGITGFVAITKGSELYEKAKELYPHVQPHVLG